MVIKSINLSQRALNELPSLQKGEPAEEYHSKTNSRIRIIVTHNGISLVTRFSCRGKRYYWKFGTFPEMKIPTFIKLAEQYISDVQSGEFDKGNNFTLHQVVNDVFMPYSKRHHRDPKNVKSRLKAVLSDLGDRKIGGIKPRDVTNFLNGLEGLSNATVNRYRSLISKIFSLAVDLEIVTKNPCSVTKKLPENSHRVRILSLPEIEVFWRFALLDSNMFQACSLLLSLITGIRIGNVISMKYSMISPDRSFVTLPITKSGKPQRVYLNGHAQQIIHKCSEVATNDYVFPSLVKDGQHISCPRTCLKRIQGVMLKEGCFEGHFNIHDLRRTFASFMLLATGDIRLAQQSLGHSHVTMTETYAIHSNPQLALATAQTAEVMLPSTLNF